jgi:hypothetical protein
MKAGKPHITADVLAQAVELQRQGLTHEAIADRLGFSRRNLGERLHKLNVAALARLRRRADGQLARQLLVLEGVVAESVAAWQRSKAPSVQVTTTTAGGGSKTRTVKSQAGDARFLDSAMKAMAEIRHLLDIADPKPDPMSNDFCIDLSDYIDHGQPPAIEGPDPNV